MMRMRNINLSGKGDPTGVGFIAAAARRGLSPPCDEEVFIT